MTKRTKENGSSTLERAVKAVVLTTAGALALSACASGENASEPRPTVTVTATATPEVEQVPEIEKNEQEPTGELKLTVEQLNRLNGKARTVARGWIADIEGSRGTSLVSLDDATLMLGSGEVSSQDGVDTEINNYASATLEWTADDGEKVKITRMTDRNQYEGGEYLDKSRYFDSMTMTFVNPNFNFDGSNAISGVLEREALEEFMGRGDTQVIEIYTHHSLGEIGDDTSWGDRLNIVGGIVSSDGAEDDSDSIKKLLDSLLNEK